MNVETIDRLELIRTQLDRQGRVRVSDLASELVTYPQTLVNVRVKSRTPVESVPEISAAVRKVEQAIRSVEEERWARTDPEKSARADDMVTKLEDAIAKIEADLAAAQASGNEKKAKDLAENLESRQAFLEMARRAATDFSG